MYYEDIVMEMANEMISVNEAFFFKKKEKKSFEEKIDSNMWLTSDDRAQMHIANCITKVVNKVWDDNNVSISSNLDAMSNDEYSKFSSSLMKEIEGFKEKQQAIIRLKPTKLEDAASYVKAAGWTAGKAIKVDNNTTLIRCIKDCGGSGSASGTAICEITYDGTKSTLIFYYIHMSFNDVKDMINDKPN